MMSTLELALAAAGATLVVTHSPLGSPLRKTGFKLFSCPLCFGFWAGCATQLLYHWTSQPLIHVPLLGLATGFLAYTLSSFATWFDLHGARIREETLEAIADHIQPFDPLDVARMLGYAAAADDEDEDDDELIDVEEFGRIIGVLRDNTHAQNNSKHDDDEDDEPDQPPH